MAASSALRALSRSAPATARSLILAALDAEDGNRTRAALRLRAEGYLVGSNTRAPITLHEILTDLPGLRAEVDARYRDALAAAMVARGEALADVTKTRAKPRVSGGHKKK